MSLVRAHPWLFACTSTGVFLSAALDGVSLLIHVGEGPGGYIGKVNWSLYPIFFLILGVFSKIAWDWYIEAWRNLPENHVVYRGQQLETANNALDPLVTSLIRLRPLMVITAIVLGVVLTCLDAGCLWSEYIFHPGTQACCGVDFTDKFLSTGSGVSMLANGVFDIAAYALQGGLIAFGWYVLFVLTANGILFMFFEHFVFAQQNSLTLRLNIRDPVKEFGLRKFNRNLNIVYFFIVLSMLAPVLSAYKQNPQCPLSLGQYLFRWLLPLIVAAPLLIPIADRVLRRDEAQDRAATSTDPADLTGYEAQRLWPFQDFKRLGWIGATMLLVALGEYAYLYNHNVCDITAPLHFCIGTTNSTTGGDK